MITLHSPQGPPMTALVPWAEQVDRWAAELAHVAKHSGNKAGVAELVFLNHRWGEFAETVVKERLLERVFAGQGRAA